jgi:thymidine phosphorylase
MNPLEEWIVSHRLLLAIAMYTVQQGIDYRTQLIAIAKGHFTEIGYDAIREKHSELGGSRTTPTDAIKFAAHKLLREV